jgi:hypothetical protein
MDRTPLRALDRFRHLEPDPGWLDGLLLIGLGMVALALRLPELQYIPAFTDERNDIFLALRIVRGEALPLTNDPSYVGAFWNYVLATAFWLWGEQLVVPRIVVLALGVVGVLAAYPLGYACSGRLGGILTTLLVATSAGHIAFTSRVAWSHSITPLFVTVGAWALISAVGPHGRVLGGRVMLAGLAWGLACQSHPTALALLPGAAAFTLGFRRQLLTSRWLYVAGAAFLLVNVNLLIYNLTTGFDSLGRGIEQSGEYAEGVPLSWPLYLERAGLLMLGLFQSLGGAVDLYTDPFELLLDPGLWPVAVLAAVGSIGQWRRGNALPCLLVASALLVLPLVNGKYNLVPNGRYLAPLLPILYAGVAASLVVAIQMARRAGLAYGNLPRSVPVAVSGGLLAVATLVIAHPLVYLRGYQQDVTTFGWTNEPVFEALSAIEEYPGDEAGVLLDRGLNVHISGWGNGTPRDAFELGLTMSRTPYRVVDVRDDDNTSKLLARSGRCRDQLVVLAPREAVQNDEIVRRLGLQPWWGSSMPSIDWGASFPIYLLARAPGAPAGC